MLQHACALFRVRQAAACGCEVVLHVCDETRARDHAGDRRMAEDFDSAMAAAGPRTRQALIVTRDNFLAYRERCRSNACIEEAYEDRRDEIRDIMRDSD